MNVIIPEKRRDKGSSFNQLVSYISDRGSKPKDDQEVTEEPRHGVSQSKQAVFDRLVDYIDRHDGDDRAVLITEVLADGRQRLVSSGVSCETNCFSWETAAAEMNMVAAQNRRCLDPVYHFILSWRENEAPTDEQIFECAAYCMKQIGMEGHQYVTAVHQDTDNVHCHVAVNRVNPINYKAANLWNDADKLQKSCRVLERTYGFIQDNGSWEWGVNDQLVRAPFRFTRAPRDAVPLQVYSNTESLYHYAVDQVRDEVTGLLEQNTFTWDEAHSLLLASGLGLREQGEGLVVYDFLRPDGPVVKASSVHPTLTKATLEPHVGNFRIAPQFDLEISDSHPLIKSTYKPQFELRDKDARFVRRQERADARLDLKMRYKRYREAWEKPDLNVALRQREIADHFRAVKANVKDKFNDPLLRKLMYRVAEFDRMKAMAELRIQLRSERQTLTDKGLAKALPYKAWVEQQALAGDVAAVSQLRGLAYREKRKLRLEAKPGDRIILCAPGDDSPVHDWKTHATQLRRDGSVEYMRNGVVGVRDDGDRVYIGDGPEDSRNKDNFKLALALVSHKSGERVVIDGEISFMKQTLSALRDFNREFELSRFEPTIEDQRKYLHYLEDNNDAVSSPESVSANISASDNPRFDQFPKP